MSQYRLTHGRRITSAEDYKRIFAIPSQRIASKYFRILVAANTMGHPRLGVVVSKKYSQISKKRNTLKRIIKESFRVQQASFGSIDVVVIAKKGGGGDDKVKTKQQLRKDIDALWQKLLIGCQLH